MRRWLVVMVVAALAAAGCGDSGGSSNIGTDPGAAGVEEVVRAGTAAAFSGDWAAMRSFLTDECQDRYGVADIAGAMTIALAFAAGFLGLEPDDLKRIEVDDVVIDEMVAGESALARSSTSLDGESFTSIDEDSSEYTYQGGRWRIVECDFDEGFGGDDGGDVGGESSAQEVTGPGSRDEPYPVGQPVELEIDSFNPDADGSTWTITVGAATDHTETVLADNDFNDPPADGRLFLAVPITVRYEGGAVEPLAFAWAADISMFGPDSLRIIDGFSEDGSCGFIEDELEQWAELFPGGEESGIWCIQVAEADVDGALLVIDAGDTLTYFATG